MAPLLKQRFQISDETDRIQDLSLSDGGHSENLGAIALLKRQMQNVLIVDAEHDPDMKFTSYKKLKAHLEKDGGRFEVPTIDAQLKSENRQPLETSVHEGIARSSTNHRDSRVIYVKMTIPRSIRQLIQKEERGMLSAGEIVDAKAFELLGPRGQKWPCEKLKTLTEIELRAWLLYKLNRYAKYINEDSGWAMISRFLPASMKMQFPHYPTLDQSFYVDQSLAFVGLGYFQTSELPRLNQ